MSKVRKRTLTAVVFFIVGIAFMCLDSPSAKALGGIFTGASVAMAIRYILDGKYESEKNAVASRLEPHDTHALAPHQGRVEAAVEMETTALHGQRLGVEYRKRQWHIAETAVDEMLDMFITLIASKLPHCTIAVFFPTHGDAYALRRYVSIFNFVDNDALIIPRRGLLGSLLTKEGLRPFYEDAFTNDSATLYYYDEKHIFMPDENIQSIMMSPIEADGETRGVMLVDSTKQNAYTEDDLTFLTNTAKLLGRAIYYAYLNTQHSLDYQRLVAMSNIEKDFWKDLDFDIVMDKMYATIRDAVPCDRYTVSLKSEEEMRATVVRAYGEDAAWFKDLNFPLGDSNPRSLVNLAYSTDIGFYRNFSEGRYEYRYAEDEPENHGFGSFVAIPIGIDRRIGVIMIESVMKDAFSSFNFSLLSRLSTSAGLALEKIFIIRKADALATHDGLTGLFNRTHFQKILTTKIAASDRHQHPVSLVLCDIDFFKNLNDTHGHPFGDAVLKGVAAKLESCIRIGTDVVARFGGEEFVMIIDQCDRNAARDSVDRIRMEIEAMVFKTTEGIEVKTSMSFGIAEYPLQARDIKELVNKADEAMYAAKKNGRNRVNVYWAESSTKFIKNSN